MPLLVMPAYEWYENHRFEVVHWDKCPKCREPKRYTIPHPSGIGFYSSNEWEMIDTNLTSHLLFDHQFISIICTGCGLYFTAKESVPPTRHRPPRFHQP